MKVLIKFNTNRNRFTKLSAYGRATQEFPPIATDVYKMRIIKTLVDLDTLFHTK